MVEPVDGLLVHANHWLSPVALGKFAEPGITNSPCSFWRDQRARRLLAPHRRIGIEDVRTVLLDDLGTPLSICVPPRPSNVTGTTATVASLIMQPGIGEMDVAMMPAWGAHYMRYTLGGEPATLPVSAHRRCVMPVPVWPRWRRRACSPPAPGRCRKRNTDRSFARGSIPI